MSRPPIADVVIAGGGIIGLSLGLELLQRGLSVVVLERHQAMRAASWAAGGMLAAHDTENPLGSLLPLSLRSLALYPAYLERVRALSGQPVPLRTHETIQQVQISSAEVERDFFQDAQRWIPGLVCGDAKFIWLEEESLDPRDLCSALPRAFSAEKGILLEDTAVLGVESSQYGVTVETSRERIHAATFVNCCGAWSEELRLGATPVEPIKGQMVAIALAPERLRCVLRTPEFYAIPRGDGRTAIGATLEHAGFDQTVHERSIVALLEAAARLLPEISNASRLESWAGLRPGTPDGLPILGPAIRGQTEMEHCWHATGHYRNGVLLAPVTARIMAQAMLGETPDVPLHAFSPARFQVNGEPRAEMPCGAPVAKSGCLG